jgi:hypothetical protein
MPDCLKSVRGGVEITVKVVPGSSRDRIVGVLGDALKIQVAAPPEKGRANQAVIKLLAEALNASSKDVEVIAGETSPRKVIRVRGASVEQVRTALDLD